MILYALIDTWHEEYGEERLCGIFDDQETAQRIADNLTAMETKDYHGRYDYRCRVVPVTLNQLLKQESWEDAADYKLSSAVME